MKVIKLENPKIISLNMQHDNMSLQVPNPMGHNDGGGEPPMDNNKYVTHEELKKETKIINDNFDQNIQLLDAHIDTKLEKFNTTLAESNGKSDTVKSDLSGKVENLQTNLNGKFDVLMGKIDAQSKILWWFMGLVGTGIIIPFFAFIYKAIFK